jgi:hypothetical protein
MQALTEANRFVELLHAETGHGDSFAEWACIELFDRSDFWAGQWGGGLTSRAGRWERPVEPALTFYPISAGVLLPYLIRGLRHESGRHLRWSYQFTVGQLYRLPPAEQDQLRLAIEVRCGPGEPPIELLRHAADDPRAVRMLRETQVD